MQSYRIYAAMLIAAALSACSVSTGKKPGGDSEFLSQMVIDRQLYDRDLNKTCAHTRECTAPLTCLDGKCAVPPSISGIRDDRTPSLRLSTQTGEHVIWLEIADDEYTMTRGLMMRRVCLEGWGMLFAYPNQARRAFWMHNTYIPLDMVFIRADGSVSNVVENAEPLNDVPRYMSTDKVRYVLELPAGSAAKYGLRSGSRLDIGSIRR